MISLSDIIIMAVVGAILGGYVVTSVILFFYPTLLHKKKHLKFRPVHISHRGGAGENLENTMAAFHHAKSLGTEMLEIDCQITRDGQVVVSHDASLQRSCGCDINIMEVDYQELPLLKEELKLDFDPSFTCKGCPDRRIPLLQEVFQAFPDLAINIDIKTDNDLLIQKVNNLIKEYNRESITAWGNASNVVTNKLYKINPNIPLIFSLKRVMILTLAFYTGFLPFMPLKESLLEVVMPRIVSNRIDIMQKLTRSQRVIVRLVDKLLMSPVLFRHLERRGIQTYLWVLNEEEHFHDAFRMGVAGVMTDFPTKLRRYLDENNSRVKGQRNNGDKFYDSIQQS